MAEGLDYCGPVKTSHKGFCLSTLEKLMEYWPGGSYIIIKINTRVTGDRPLMALVYKYNYRKVIGFIATEGSVITELVHLYLSRFPEIYSNISVRPVFHPHLLGRYLNDCN